MDDVRIVVYQESFAESSKAMENEIDVIVCFWLALVNYAPKRVTHSISHSLYIVPLL